MSLADLLCSLSARTELYPCSIFYIQKSP